MNLKKKSIILTLAILILLTSGVQIGYAKSSERNIKIWINDFYIMSDVHPFLENGLTYVPLRFIAEELGYNVSWNGKDKTILINDENTTLKFQINSKDVYVNGEKTYLQAPAKLKQDRTFVPFRAIAEHLGEEVNYDNEHKIAIIGDDYKADEYYPLKYYLNNETPFITILKVNFVNYFVKYSDGRVKKLNNDSEILNLVDKEGSTHQEIEFETDVKEDKKVYDKHYIAPIKEDPFVGSWYGTTKTIGTNEYYDGYVYIEKLEDGRYLFKNRNIKDNGSELITESYATYNARNGILYKNLSHKTIKATGDFNQSSYTTSGNFNVEDFSYMYVFVDPKLNYSKY